MVDRKATPAGGEKVLVVDDDSIHRELLGQFLKAKGYEVALAASGEQALELVDRTALDLVLLDLSLPRANSLEVLKQLRGDHSAADLPVIMVSGENDSSRVVEALTLGANDYISKPIEFGMAIGRIRTQLARKKLENKLRTAADPLRAESASTPDTLPPEQPDALGGQLAVKPQMRDPAAGSNELERDLRNAITNQEFALYYQPKVQLENGRLLGFEALLR